MASDSLYASKLPLMEVGDTTVVFGGDSPDAEMVRWGEPDNRPIAPTRFEFDKHYWELAGKPDEMIFGMADEPGWEKYINPPYNGMLDPRAGVVWLEAFEIGKDDDNNG